MKLDIRNNRDYSKTISFQQLWLKEQFTRLRKVYTKEEVSNDMLKEILLDEYSKRLLIDGRLYNNVDNSNKSMNQETFINTFLNKPYILSGYGVFYENQNNSTNIGAAALKFLLETRGIYKQKQKDSVYGSDEYVFNKINQLTYKLLANSYYGILGEKNSTFYNSFVQNSITMTGQDLTTTTIIGLENFLADNVQFNDFDDVMNFISHVDSEKRQRSILDYLNNKVVTNDDLFKYFKEKTNNLPEDMEEVLKKLVSTFDEEKTNVLYYKNRVLDFIDDTWGKSMLSRLSMYTYEAKPEEAMIEPLKEFRDIVIEFCYTDILFEDRFKRVVKDYRKSTIASDTDSVFINLKNYIDKTNNDLQLDKTDKVQQQTVMNIYVDVVTEVLERMLSKLTNNMGILKEYEGLINMKSEFVYRRIMTTYNKKHYAGIITAELGELLPEPDDDIKGLQIRKSSVPKVLKKRFKKILIDDILLSESIDLKDIIDKFDLLSKEIEASLIKGESTFAIPKKGGAIDDYKIPSSIEPLRGAIVWNQLEPENSIVFGENVNIIKLKPIDKDDPLLEALKQTHPKKHKIIMKTVFNEGVAKPKLDFSRFGFTVISMPKSQGNIPDYLTPLIDLESMVNFNISNGYILLESLGVYCDEVANVKYKSNIIEI